jgi:hypothetical protein
MKEENEVFISNVIRACSQTLLDMLVGVGMGIALMPLKIDDVYKYVD